MYVEARARTNDPQIFRSFHIVYCKWDVTALIFLFLFISALATYKVHIFFFLSS